MNTHTIPELESPFAGANKAQEGRYLLAGSTLACHGPCCGPPPNSLRLLRFLLFNRPDLAGLALAGFFTALLALSPAAARAQGAIEAWVQRYNGPANAYDYAAALALDAAGNVYVIGSVTVGDGYASDWTTIKYSNAGVPLWTNTYSGPVNDWNYANAVAVDKNGDLIVAGSVNNGLNNDYVTIKYSSTGLPLWTNSYAGPRDSWDDALAIALDANGNAIVTGKSGADCATIAYSSEGVPLWTNRYTSTDARAVAVDANGDTFVTGSSNGDYVTIAYSRDGALLWVNRYRAPAGGWSTARAVAVDAAGSVIVTGWGGGDYATVAYSLTGVPLWTNRYNGPGNADDWAEAVAVDAVGNVIVTGGSTPINGDTDYATVAYSSAGVPLWTNRYNGPANGSDFANAVAVDARRIVCVSGYSTGSGSGRDYTTVAYSGTGSPLWTNHYNGPGNGFDEAKALAVDTQGNVYVTGCSTSTGNDYDFATVKYVSTAVIITRQPLSRTNAAGTAAIFTVEVVGSLPFSYQWRMDGTNLEDAGRLSGVTTTNLLIANVQVSDAGDYTVLVTNEWGSATSAIAHLTVTIPPSAGRFTNFKYSPETGFSLIFRDGTVGQPYRIQRSTSAVEGSWMEWMNFTYSEPTAFTDVSATGSERRFYRAVSP